MSTIGINALAGGDPSLLFQAIGDSSLAMPAKFTVAFPLAYNFIGGCRHAYWDAKPEAITNDAVEQSSYAVGGLSLMATAVACVL